MGHARGLGTIANELTALKAAGKVNGSNGVYWLTSSSSSFYPSENENDETYRDFCLLESSIDAFLGLLKEPSEFAFAVVEFDCHLHQEKQRLLAANDERGLQKLYDSAMNEFWQLQAELWLK